MYITWANAFALFITLLVIAFICIWVWGTYAAHKEGGLPWFNAALHVLSFLLFWPWAYFIGWIGWFLAYGFSSGFNAANDKYRHPERAGRE